MSEHAERPLRTRLAVGLPLLLIIGTLTLVPLGFVLLHSLSDTPLGTPLDFSLAPFERIFATHDSVRAMGISALLTVRVPLGLAIATALAWALIRLDLPGHRLIMGALWFSFFLPILPMAMGWSLLADKNNGLINTQLQQLGLTDGPIVSISSIPGILFVHLTLSTVPIMTILLAPAVRRLDPAFEEASEVLGARLPTTLRRVTAPMLLPAVGTAFVAGLIKSFEVFEVEQYLGIPSGIHVYSTRIYQLIQTIPSDYPQAMALSAVFLVVLLLVAVGYQVMLNKVGRVSTVKGQGRAPHRRERRRKDWLISGLLFLTLSITLVTPLAMLVAGSFTKIFGLFDLADPWTTQHWSEAVSSPRFMSALGNSFGVGVLVALIGCLTYTAIAFVLARIRPVGSTAIALLVWLPWAIPGILLGISFLSLLTTYAPGLMLTLVPMILVLVVQGMPLGVSMMQAAIQQVPEELEDASRAVGAGQTRTFVRVTTPLILPMLTSVLVLTFMAALRDISTTVLLARPGTTTLSLLMFETSASGQTETAAVIGVLTAGAALLAALTVAALGARIQVEG